MNIQALIDVYNEDSPFKTTEVSVGRYAKRDIKFEIQTLSSSEVHDITKRAINRETGEIDREIYNELLLEKCMLTFNPTDVEVMEAFDAQTTSEVLNKMFSASEYMRFTRMCDSYAIKGELPQDLNFDGTEKPIEDKPKQVDLKK